MACARMKRVMRARAMRSGVGRQMISLSLMAFTPGGHGSMAGVLTSYPHSKGEPMKAVAAVAEILKRGSGKVLLGYPVNPINYAGPPVGQARTGLHMADAVSRVTSGKRIGVFTMQHGPGSENAFGGVAQAYGDSVPIVVLPGGYPRRITNLPPNFNSALNYRHVTKWIE